MYFICPFHLNHLLRTEREQYLQATQASCKEGPLKWALLEVGTLVHKDYVECHNSSDPHQYSI